MTEDEARTKWCAEARILVELKTGDVITQLATANIFPDGLRATCIASDCMKWDWLTGEPSSDPFRKSIDDPLGQRSKPLDPRAREGDCGLKR